MKVRAQSARMQDMSLAAAEAFTMGILCLTGSAADLQQVADCEVATAAHDQHKPVIITMASSAHRRLHDEVWQLGQQLAGMQLAQRLGQPGIHLGNLGHLCGASARVLTRLQAGRSVSKSIPMQGHVWSAGLLRPLEAWRYWVSLHELLLLAHKQAGRGGLEAVYYQKVALPVWQEHGALRK